LEKFTRMFPLITKQFLAKGLVSYPVILVLFGFTQTLLTQSHAQTPAERGAHFSENTSDLIVFAFPVAGWYLISLPVVVQDSTARTLFPMADTVITWQNDRYVGAATIEIGKGYWLFVSAPATAFVQGDPVTQFTRHFTPGWHLLGSVMDSVGFSNPKDTPDSSVAVPIYNWNMSAQKYDTTTAIEQSFGQWIAVVRECGLTIDADAPSNSTPQFVDETELQAFYQRFGSQPPPPPFPLRVQTPQVLLVHPALHDNYPNPFVINGGFGNGTTVIRFVLPRAEVTRISIYNSLGQEMRVLLAQKQPAGVHEVRWDGRDNHGRAVGSGIYFYRISTKDFSETKKMLLIR